MSNSSPAYRLAERLHAGLYEDAANQARGMLRPGEVRADISSPYKTLRLTVFGEVDGRKVYQHLSKSQRNGIFYLSTVFTEPGGEVIIERITPESPNDCIEVIESTILMNVFRNKTSQE